MKYLKKFLKESIYDDSDMLNIQLSRREYELLESILHDSFDQRVNMGCNDAEEHEENLFTDEEKMEIAEYLEKDESDNTMYLFNFDYVDYIQARLREEFENNNIG